MWKRENGRVLGLKRKIFHSSGIKFQVIQRFVNFPVFGVIMMPARKHRMACSSFNFFRKSLAVSFCFLPVFRPERLPFLSAKRTKNGRETTEKTQIKGYISESFRITWHGFPAANTSAGISLVTTLPASITLRSPMVTPGQITVLPCRIPKCLHQCLWVWQTPFRRRVLCGSWNA